MDKPTEGSLADLSLWALAALGCWAIAIVGGNVGGMVPPDVYAFLHASRLNSGSVAQISSEVAGLQLEAARLKRENIELQQRLGRSEDKVTLLTQRLGTVETSLPRITEALAATAAPALDSTTTGSIAGAPVTNDDGSISFETEGGSVTVRQSPLVLPATSKEAAKPATAAPLDLALPTPLSDALEPQQLEPATMAEAQPATDSPPIGVALGIPVDADAIPGIWSELKSRTGAVLDHLTLRTIAAEEKGKRTLIVGPIANATAAAALCKVLSETVTSCSTTTFSGDPVATTATGG